MIYWKACFYIKHNLCQSSQNINTSCQMWQVNFINKFYTLILNIYTRWATRLFLCVNFENEQFCDIYSNCTQLCEFTTKTTLSNWVRFQNSHLYYLKSRVNSAPWRTILPSSSHQYPVPDGCLRYVEACVRRLSLSLTSLFDTCIFVCSFLVLSLSDALIIQEEFCKWRCLLQNWFQVDQNWKLEELYIYLKVYFVLVVIYKFFSFENHLKNSSNNCCFFIREILICVI